MILLIDNYDSFTYNLYQYLCELTDAEVRVVRNDRITAEEALRLSPSHIVISPGPGRPEDAGVSVELIRRAAGTVPVLGVCLGHQAVAEAFGGRIVRAVRIVHGKAEQISLDGRGLFRSLPATATFTRYHSLAVERASVPEVLEVTATADDGEIMGLRHREYVVEAVQFHPESIAGEFGKRLLANFLRYRREPFVVKPLLDRLIAGERLSEAEASGFMDELTEGNLTPAQIAGVLVSIASRGPTPQEIAGCARVLQLKRTPIVINRPVLDTCGTGGDGLHTFNISSFSALIAAACGATVAKHGNRAVSSKSGSAEFYKALGFAIDLPPAASQRLLEEQGFAFLFAPIYHQAMRHAAVPRRDLGVKTIMNLLGPLVNPAGADYQLIGVYDERYAPVVAEAAHLLGIRRAVIVHGHDGQDELSVCAPSTMILVEEDGATTETEVRPEELGMTVHPPEALLGGTAEENAQVARELLSGGGPAAVRDAVVLNAGAALWLYGTAADLTSGVKRAAMALADGSVATFVQAAIERSVMLADAARQERVAGAAP
jgi:anthranilate synthase/phosphoribosyltransferase